MDQNNKPIQEVKIVGANVTIFSDEKGHFSLFESVAGLPQKLDFYFPERQIIFSFYLPYLEEPVVDLYVRLFKVAPEKIFLTEVFANPSTGYSWELDKIYNPEVLKPYGQYFLPSSSETRNVGSGGKLYLFFETQRPGSTLFVYRYQRPWMEAKSARALFIGLVNVWD
jgi:predicted secreted protein